MGYPRLGGEGGRGGDVWFIAQERSTLKGIKARYPQKRFVAGSGANSRFVWLVVVVSICPSWEAKRLSY